MEKIIIAVDLGHFKAFRVTKNPSGSSKADIIESYDSLEAHGKLSDKYSDANGRFGLAGGKNGAATGNSEPHNTQLEVEKRAIKLIAKDINAIIAREGFPKWHLAAAKGINGQILDYLDPAIKSKLEKNITADLTKSEKSDILKRFD